MKKYNHPIDDLFREALQDHRMAPSDTAKKAFLRDAAQIPPAASKGKKGLFLLFAFLLLASAGIFLWAIRPEKATVTQKNTVQETHSQITQPDQESLVTEENQQPSPTYTPEPGVQVVNKTADKNSKPKQIQDQNQRSNPQKGNVTQPFQTSRESNNELTVNPALLASNTPINGQSAGSSPEEPAQHPEIQAEENLIVPPAAAVDPVSPARADSAPAIKINNPDPVLDPETNSKDKNTDSFRKKSKLAPSVGVYYTPEWMFNTLEGSKFVNNFGFEGTFRFGKFSVRTGAGISMAKGTNELIVEYNDYLGAYNKLDSMEFTWNEPSHSYTPKMFLSQQDVWDSLMKLDYPKVVKRYTYLQIPLVMGYDFWESERISIGVRVGPVLSVLLATKQLSAAYDPGTKRVISINDIAPEQVNLNWQVMAGMSTAFRITETLNFEIEPCVRYYFNSVYEKPVDNAKPWSVGVRAAVVVKF
jgi:FtsZ-interacting cell division protein ZipA